MFLEGIVLGGFFAYYVTLLVHECMILRRRREILPDLPIYIVTEPNIMIISPQSKKRVPIDIQQVAPLCSDPLDPGTTCSICFEEIDALVPYRKTKCNHIYCDTCIHSWIQKKPICPLCMANLDPNIPA
jgi:hypothetical protein